MTYCTSLHCPPQLVLACVNGGLEDRSTDNKKGPSSITMEYITCPCGEPSSTVVPGKILFVSHILSITPTYCLRNHRILFSHSWHKQDAEVHWSQLKESSGEFLRICGGMDDNDSHRFIHVNTFVPRWWNGLAKIKRYDIVGKCVSLGLGLDVSKAHAIPS